MATLIIGLIVAIVIALIILKLILNRRKGETSCGCSCEGCPSAGVCHSNSNSVDKDRRNDV